MKAPNCRVCGAEHWSGEEHQFVTHASLTRVTHAQRQRKYREAHPDRHAQQQRAYRERRKVRA